MKPPANDAAPTGLAGTTGSRVFSFEVWVKGFEQHPTKINARTPGKAKRMVHLDVSDCWPDLPFTAMRVRKIGEPHTSQAFIRNAIYRGLPDVRCGQRVKVGAARGVIVGHNSSANFDVLFDDDSPLYAGQVLNCHPQGVTLDHENAKVTDAGAVTQSKPEGERPGVRVD